MGEKNYSIIDRKEIEKSNFIKPDTCPFCHHGIKPEIFFGYEFERDFKKNIRVIYSCPRTKCLEMFFGMYSIDTINIYADKTPNFRGCTPFKYEDEEFGEAVEEISLNFINIYNQAKEAENRGLDQICGLGYRKSLEFLIKDYLVLEYPDEAENIKQNHRFDNVIEKYVTEEKVKFLARRASWLGNDEAHYTRKWDDKDIMDLKRLIKTCIYWISAEKELEYYKKEMTEGK